jgi:hypothetical protein
VSDPKLGWTLNVNDEPADIDVSYLSGLKDVQGSYTGLLNMSSGDMALFTGDGAREIYFYAPREGNLIQRILWRIRESLFHVPWPNELIFSGKADLTIANEEDEEGNVTATGTFRWPPSE